jgi:hypothetical protein
MASDPKPEMSLTTRVILVVEYDHPSAWQASSPADQVFRAGEHEAKNALEHLLRAHGEGRYRVISAEGTVIVAKRKKT